MQEKWLYGYSQPEPRNIMFHPVRQLSDQEYLEAGLAVKTVLDVITGPNAFAEITRRDLTQTVQHLSAELGRSIDVRGVERWGPELEYRVLAVSAALRMHEEYALASAAKQRDEAVDIAVKQVFIDTYDRSLPYRIMYALRNALVHGSRSLTAIKLTGKLQPDETTSMVLALTLSRSGFAATKARAPLRSEVSALTMDPELIELAAQALDDLATMRDSLEPLLYPEASDAAHLLFGYAREVNEAGFSGPHFHAHDEGNPLRNMTNIGMSEAIFNHVVAYVQREERRS
jgi:hypothetical protein